MHLVEDKVDWVVGFEDECWWSRVRQPNLHSFGDAGEPLRLEEQSVEKDDPSEATKAISCYGLYMPELKEAWLRFVDGPPVSGITTRFLEWCCQKLAAIGKKVLVLIWDNAGEAWHISREVRRWIGRSNRALKKGEIVEGMRIVSCLLPKKSPWLNAMEPKWIHGKRKVVEPDGLLGAYELAERVCAAFGCPHNEHLSIAENVASSCARASTGLPAGCRYGADLTPSASTLHCEQDLIFATEIGRLLDASNMNQRSFKALLLYVGLHPARFHDPRHTAPYERSSPKIV